MYHELGKRGEGGGGGAPNIRVFALQISSSFSVPVPPVTWLSSSLIGWLPFWREEEEVVVVVVVARTCFQKTDRHCDTLCKDEERSSFSFFFFFLCFVRLEDF